MEPPHEPIIIKNPEQIEGIRKSCKLAANTLVYLEQFIKPGVSTEDIDKLADDYIKSHNATSACLGYRGFPKSICTSINEVICHGIPSKKDVLKDGDIINIDITTILDGYFGDTSKTFTVGQVSDKTQLLVDITRECLVKGIQECIPGKRLGDIGYAINKHAVRNGFTVVYQFVGHGVGLSFHEPPNIPHVGRKNTGEQLSKGMIFTIEPMINVGEPEIRIDEYDGWTARTTDGKLSAQFEHTILITENGCEILTIPD